MQLIPTLANIEMNLNMKTIILTIIFLSFFKIYGQTYTPFIDTNSVWREHRISTCSHGSSYLHKIEWDEELYLHGDTIIGNNYSKLYMKGSKWEYEYNMGPNIDDTTYYCDYLIGGLREDSLKQVYFKPINGSEKLLYNFNLSVGDSIYYWSYNTLPNFYIHVVSIDSVYILNKYRKRFNFDKEGSLIEGIGMEFGLLGNDNWSPSYVCLLDRLKAYFYNNTIAYFTPNIIYYPQDSATTLINCNTVDIIKISENKSVVVFPNPFNESTTILFDNNMNEIYDLFIYNVTGELVNRVNKISGNKVSIYKKDIGTGMFLACLRKTKTGEQIFIKKLIVK